jgi:hypothetical protein
MDTTSSGDLKSVSTRKRLYRMDKYRNMLNYDHDVRADSHSDSPEAGAAYVHPVSSI